MKKEQFQKLCARLTIIFMTVILLAAVPLPRGISKAGIQAYASVSQKRSVKPKINEKRKKVTKKKKLKKKKQSKKKQSKKKKEKSKKKKTQKTAKKGKRSSKKTSKATSNHSKGRYKNENVMSLYGDGRDFFINVGGKIADGHYDAQMSMQLLQIMDAYRQSKGLGEFYKNAVLTKAAMQRSIEITTVFDHTRPDGKPWYTVDPYVSGENIAAGYQTAVQFMSSFANSPTHNANLLNANFKTAGVAVFVEKGPYGYTYFVTQLFGR